MKNNNIIKTIIKKTIIPVLDAVNRQEWHFWLAVRNGKINLSDKNYLRLLYHLTTGKTLHLFKPKLFSEKIQWLKLYYHNPQLTTLADKVSAREYVSKKIGKQYLVPTLGIYNTWEEIDFDSLPNQFVIKCTHDSGGISICKNKPLWDKENSKKIISNSLHHNYYQYSREWQYKNIPPRILIEELLIDNSNTIDNGLIDYKFYCFNGHPKFLYVAYNVVGVGKEEPRMIYLDLEWKKTPFQRPDHEPLPLQIKKPQVFDEMVEISKRLSNGIPFVRVDLYCIENKIYFSEMTFTPGGGFSPFYPLEWERKIGDMLVLPPKLI